MMPSDKKRFDEIFNSDKHFKTVSDVGFLRAACECEKLFEYLQCEGIAIEDELDVKKYMQFAYWLGVLKERG